MLLFRRLYAQFSIVLELIAVTLIAVSDISVVGQDTGFEIPVQLLGFPVIVMAVRTSNFVRKLAYALNPSSWRRISIANPIGQHSVYFDILRSNSKDYCSLLCSLCELRLKDDLPRIRTMLTCYFEIAKAAFQLHKPLLAWEGWVLGNYKHIDAEKKGTYRRSIRTVRGTDSEPPLNYDKADQMLMKQLGSNYCVYEEVCLNNIRPAGAKASIDWTDIINKYTELPADKQQYYLMSVFLGNIIRSKKLCQHFNDTGRICR